MEAGRVGRSGGWPLALLASTMGVALANVLAVVTGLDNRLVAAYRAGRALPYRTTFFVLVFCFGFALSRGVLGGVRRRVVRATLAGALLGYVSGFLAWWIVQCVFISTGGAWMALRDFPAGLEAPFIVPLLTLSWVFGAVALLTTHLIIQGRMVRAGE
jgi:hypothetical protein